MSRDYALDAMRDGRGIGAWLGLIRAYAVSGVPACWVFEAPARLGASITVFRADGIDFEEGSTTTREAFDVDFPYPVSIDLDRLSCRWPDTFEYIGHRLDEGGAE